MLPSDYHLMIWKSRVSPRWGSAKYTQTPRQIHTHSNSHSSSILARYGVFRMTSSSHRAQSYSLSGTLEQGWDYLFHETHIHSTKSDIFEEVLNGSIVSVLNKLCWRLISFARKLYSRTGPKSDLGIRKAFYCCSYQITNTTHPTEKRASSDPYRSSAGRKMICPH